MTDKDAIADRGRAIEDEYFYKKDQELIKKMKRAATAARTREEIGKRTGLTDPDMLQELETLGFTPETVVLLPLVPVVQVAWAEGGVTPEERRLVVELARARGVERGGAADRQLSDWLDRRPAQEVFAHAARLIRALLATPEHGDLTVDDIVQQCEAVADASGGLLNLNLIGRVSAEEREILRTLVAQLKGRAG